MRHYRKALIFLFVMLFAREVYPQEGLALRERRFALQATEASVEAILEKLVNENELYLSYNPEILPSGTHTIQGDSLTLGALLDRLLPPQKFLVEIAGSQIIITQREAEPLRITGSVTDRRELLPVPYASVVIGNESIGTMTNQEGCFDLVIPRKYIGNTLVIRSLGYGEERIPISDTMKVIRIELLPVSIRLKEIEVKPVSPLEVLHTFRQRIALNYEQEPQLMLTFYRETIQQDGIYLGIWEAVMEVLKNNYHSEAADRVRFVKGRKQDLNPESHNLRLKIQGGPWYINKLDVVKTMESFLSPEFEQLYDYRFEQPEMVNNRVTWVIRFARKGDVDFPCFYGSLLIDADSYALVGANFSFDNKSLKMNGESFIRREPSGVETRPAEVSYRVNYRLYNGKWQFYSAHSQVVFKIKQKRVFKTEYSSTTDVLVTQQYRYPRHTRFGPEGVFRADDIFSEIIGPYDPDFWGNYNIIKPDEELVNAIKSAKLPPANP